MKPAKDIVKKVKETISRYGMINPGDKVIVAVSGGPDSICMLDVLNGLSSELEIGIVVAHYNHGLRENEDESETLLVRSIAESKDLFFETVRNDYLKDGTASIEERARDARYSFLEEVRRNHKAQKIAVGHNLNDQAETVLMRLLRGSGPSGLAGIPPVRDNRIIRPFIEIQRGEIMAYLKARDLPYIFDSSNTDMRYMRNRIRLELLPLMLAYQPKLIEHLGKLSKILRDEDDFMESLVMDWVYGVAQQDSDTHISIPLSDFKSLDVPLKNRVIRHLLKKTGKNLRRIDYDHILSISDLAKSSSPQSTLDLPNEGIVKRIYDRLEIVSGTAQEDIRNFSHTLEGPGRTYLKDIDLNILLEEVSGKITEYEKDSEFVAYLDAGRIQFPMIIRNFRPGDRFVPLGMKGQKKVKDFFIDLKIPSQKRALVPILMSQDNIVWICGYRLDNRFKITPKTRNILKVTIS